MSVQTLDTVSISKEVGWKGEQRKLPPLNEVRGCAEQAKKGDKAAATRLLTWYRFCKSPKTNSEVETMNVLADGYKEVFAK